MRGCYTLALPALPASRFSSASRKLAAPQAIIAASRNGSTLNQYTKADINGSARG